MSRYKVLIIDEAHQLTEPAWNAMLKTLEEPPPHLVIILCTTAPDRIPATVKSRCQLFPFAPLQPADIRSKLARIASSLDLALEPRHLDTIAQGAEGNFRSALNLLEQCLILRVAEKQNEQVASSTQ
jgi:DNA polymerase-3 subunit gamma/tau